MTPGGEFSIALMEGDETIVHEQLTRMFPPPQIIVLDGERYFRLLYYSDKRKAFVYLRSPVLSTTSEQGRVQ